MNAPHPPSGRSASVPARPVGRFGTFSGVFTPSILTILGVVMYLRFGWVVGNAGLVGALVIVGISHLITLTTGLSISTIATNRTVGAGGAYYIISRSLGAPSGAAIGLPLFMAQALSVAFYAVGFAESIQLLAKNTSPYLLDFLPLRPVATLACVVLTLLAVKSADVAIKTQYVVMAAIGVSLVSFFAGTGPSPPPSIEYAAPEGGESFGVVFAVFFPAVTGIMAGVGMSGDLRDPRRSLPLGTLLSILVGLVVYTAFPIWLASNATLADMREKPYIVWDIAAMPSLIYIGIMGATLSSAVGSILTAPRTLQALSMDGLVPRYFGKGHGEHNEPRVATVLTFLIALGGVWLGDLDSIANTLTMFFLATYGLTNLSCGLELWAASPAFRPQFRVPWWVCFLGAIACFYVMSIIDLLAMFAAMIICGAIYGVTQRRVLGTTYGDARHGIWSALVRTALHQLRRATFHPSNWRPNLVIMGGDVEQRGHLLELGNAIVQDRGVVTFFHLLEGEVRGMAEQRRALLSDRESQIASDWPNVFFRVDVADNVPHGIVQVAQSYGLGNFEANTVMMGWPRKAERQRDYARALCDLAALDKSLLLVDYKRDRGFGAQRSVHIWWGGLKGNGGLMILLAFLMTAHDGWRSAEVSLMTIVGSEDEQAQAKRNLRRILAHARVTATPVVMLRDGRSVTEVMAEASHGADLAIIGMRLPDPDAETDESFARMGAILDALPTTILVYSARNFPGEPVLFQS